MEIASLNKNLQFLVNFIILVFYDFVLKLLSQDIPRNAFNQLVTSIAQRFPGNSNEQSHTTTTENRGLRSPAVLALLIYSTSKAVLNYR